MSEEYIKYQHVYKVGTSETEGILNGMVYIFPKLDGTNAKVWYDGTCHYGSRKRELSLDNDNAGFMAAASQDEKLTNMMKFLKDHSIFGEWLVKHNTTYKESAWRKFYVFDIVRPDGTYFEYPELQAVCGQFGIEYIPCIGTFKNPIPIEIEKHMDNKFLIETGDAEGVVIKNYNYRNKYGRVTWAKRVRDGHNQRKTKPPVVPEKMYYDIVFKYVTNAEVQKTKAKIVTERGDWTDKCIPELLSRVWYDLITENMWDILKNRKNPTINFRLLRKQCEAQTKAYMWNEEV